MRANGVLMISLTYRELWSKTLNETIHAPVCIFHQKISTLLTQDAPGFCSRCQPVFTACHRSAGEGTSLAAPRLALPLWEQGRMRGRRRLLPQSLGPALPQTSPGLRESHSGTRAALAFVLLLLLEPARGTARIIHQAVLTREQLLVTRAGLGWATGHEQKAWEPFPAPPSHSSPGKAAKEEALFKMRLLSNDREAVAPAHTLFTLGSELAFLQELGWAQSCWFKDTWNKNSRLKGFCSLLACCFFSWRALPARAECQSAEQQHLCKEAPNILANTLTSKWKIPKVCTTPKKKRLE